MIAGVAADTVESTATDGMGTTFVDEKDFAFYGRRVYSAAVQVVALT